MKRFLTMVMVLLMGLTMIFPAAAAENKFVPSISYKDGPVIESADLDGENVGNCVVVSSITDAKEKSTDIRQEDRDELLEVYEKLASGAMKLPLDGNYVIRELVDVSFKENVCIKPNHPHEEELKQEDVLLTVVFDMGIPKNVPVTVLVYVDGQWIPVESVVNNNDGTITVVFEDICPVAFCVDPNDVYESPKTGDEARRELILWVVLLAVSAVTIPVLLFLRKKSGKKYSK